MFTLDNGLMDVSNVGNLFFFLAKTPVSLHTGEFTVFNLVSLNTTKFRKKSCAGINYWSV